MNRELLVSAVLRAGSRREGAIDIDIVRRALAAQPAPAEPAALESVHLTRDTSGMCTVRVNGRTAIRDNGDIIDHMATLEWFAQPAPVPVPHGWKLVPVEHTDAMLQAGAKALYDAKPGYGPSKVYRAMIAASPEVPK